MDNIITDLMLKRITSGKPTLISLTGISMLPLLEPNDVITIQKCSTYNVDDIVMFKYNVEGYLLHRIVEIVDDNVFLCKGDNAKRIEVVMFRQILGKMIRATRFEETVYEEPQSSNK